MRIVILGASGLIGHKLFQGLSTQFQEVYGILHGDRRRFDEYGLYAGDRVIDNIDVQHFDRLCGVLLALRPDVICNCVGITKRRPAIQDLSQAIAINSLFPHKLAAWANDQNARVIHFSSDCVFDGSLGDYTEDSPTTAMDNYGRTKALGEIRYKHTLTIRSSFIGRELIDGSELLEWFLAQDGKRIKGFANALYSGVSTRVLTQVVCDIIASFPELSGLYQLAAPRPISKYDLLCLARDAFGVDTTIERDTDFIIKPTLDGSRLATIMNLTFPSWPQMMAEIATDPLYVTQQRLAG